MPKNSTKVVVGVLAVSAFIFGGYAIYDFWRFWVPPLPPQNPNKDPLKSAAALDTGTAALTKDPDVDVAATYKKSDKNAESRQVVSAGRAPIKKRKLSDL